MVAVTVTLYLPAGVPAGDWDLDVVPTPATPAHPGKRSNNPTMTPKIASDVRLRRWGVRKTNPTPGNRVRARLPNAFAALRCMRATTVESFTDRLALGRAAVLMAMFTVLMSGSIAGLGVGVQAEFCGKPLQVNVTEFLVDVVCCRVSE